MIRYIIASMFFLLSIILFAQTDSQKANYQQFELADSSIITGTIVFENETVLQIKGLNGEEFRINKSDILNYKNGHN